MDLKPFRCDSGMILTIGISGVRKTTAFLGFITDFLLLVHRLDFWGGFSFAVPSIVIYMNLNIRMSSLRNNEK